MVARQKQHTIICSAMFVKTHGTTAATEVFGMTKQNGSHEQHTGASTNKEVEWELGGGRVAMTNSDKVLGFISTLHFLQVPMWPILCIVTARAVEHCPKTHCVLSSPNTHACVLAFRQSGHCVASNSAELCCAVLCCAVLCCAVLSSAVLC